jgi:selenocysteine lyase/cysteine desulfurase
LVVVTHASNVTGAVQPIPAIGRALKDHDALFLVDAAQSLGHIPVEVDSLGADLLAAPGHKGLLGPLGTGILYLGGGVEKRLQPLRFGGTGTESQVDRQPETLPDRYESGNHNVPGILGLGAGVEFLLSRGVDSAGRHEQRLTARLLQRLGALSGVTVYGPPSAEARVAVVSLSVRGYDPQEMASILDAAYRIQVRSGLHCAPRMHEALGTTQQGGTVRLSLGPFTTEEDVDAAAAAIAELAAEH